MKGVLFKPIRLGTKRILLLSLLGLALLFFILYTVDERKSKFTTYYMTDAAQDGQVINTDSVYGGNLSISLNEKNQAQVVKNGILEDGSWREEGGELYITTANFYCKGSVNKNALYVYGIQDTGISAKLINPNYTENKKDKSAEDETTEIPIIVANDRQYQGISYTRNGYYFDYNQIKLLGAENTYILFRADGTGIICFSGTPSPMTWSDTIITADDGTIYPYSRSGNSLQVTSSSATWTMMDTNYLTADILSRTSGNSSASYADPNEKRTGLTYVKKASNIGSIIESIPKEDYEEINGVRYVRTNKEGKIVYG